MASVNSPNPPPAPSYNPTGPGSGPLGQDPAYQAALNQQRARDAQASALLNQLSQSAMYGYGGAGNPYSTLALLKQQDADNTRNYTNNLISRGIISSGETGYQAGQESKRYGLSLYNAQRALEAAMAGYKQNYLGQLNSDQDLANNALQTAYANYLANPSAYGNWNNGTLPSGLPGWVPITSPYQDPISGGGIVSYLK